MGRRRALCLFYRTIAAEEYSGEPRITSHVCILVLWMTFVGCHHGIANPHLRGEDHLLRTRLFPSIRSSSKRAAVAPIW